MQKSKLPASGTADEDARKQFSVAEGVEIVNGAKIADTTTVMLTDEEALYDLSLDRISPVDNKASPDGGA